MNHDAWDSAIESAIFSLQDAKAISRAQVFLKKFPNGLSTFRAQLSQTTLTIPLADFQQHPTYLLRWLLAEWKDEEAKALRTDFSIIISKATQRVQVTQEWRSGVGENWAVWGYKNMDDLYANYKTSVEEEKKVQAWYPQRFLGLDRENHPLHLELLPNTYEEKLLVPMTIRRIVNNEHTLRHRLILLNPPPAHLLEAGVSEGKAWSTRADVLENPIIDGTWILDARNLSLWYSSAIYKTASALIGYANTIVSTHYPEQGYRTIVLNLGVVLGSLYNVAIKVMPPQTQRTTSCFVGNEALGEVMGGWEHVPAMYRELKVRELTKEEQERFRHDLGPFVIR